MKGLLYKELRQNLWYIIVMPFCGGAGLLLCFPLLEDMLPGEPAVIPVIYAAAAGGIIAYLLAGAFQVMTLRGDDRKAWSCFISSTPKGYKGFIRMKYAVTAMMSAVCFAGTAAALGIYSAVKADGTAGLADVLMICGYLTALQLILRAVDIPFIVRFGDKKGSMIKLIGLPVLVILFVLTVIIFDIDFIKYFDRVRDFMISDSGTALKLTVSLGAAVCLYAVSCLVSCRLYLKGAEGYDR